LLILFQVFYWTWNKNIGNIHLLDHLFRKNIINYILLHHMMAPPIKKNLQISHHQIVICLYWNFKFPKLTKYIIYSIFSIHVGAWKEKKWLKERVNHLMIQFLWQLIVKLWLELLQLFIFRFFVCSLIRSASSKEDVLGLYFIVVYYTHMGY
jgi:hypothetical protein